MKRIDWDNYFMNIAVQVSLRSTCLRRRVGAVITKDNNIISTGYNGSPSGVPNCIDCPDQCYRTVNNIPSGEKLDMCVAVHAEINAILRADKNNIKGGTAYVTTFPCISCAKALVQAGIKKICYIDSYTNDYTMEILEKSNVEIQELDGSIFRTPDLDFVKSVAPNDLNSLDPLVKEIFYAGFEEGTTEFILNRFKVMQKHDLFKKYNERVLLTYWENNDSEIIPLDRFLDKNTLYKISHRYDVEYIGNSKYKQVICGAIVVCGDKVVVLKSKEGRLKNKLTMIQGHVNADNIEANGIVYANPYLMRSLVLENLDKELDEELKINKTGKNESVLDYIIHKNYICSIQTNDNKISEEHVGFIWVVNIEEKYLEYITSGEPDKHDIELLTIQELYDEIDKGNVDTWLSKLARTALKPV